MSVLYQDRFKPSILALLETIWAGEVSYVSQLPEKHLALYVWLEVDVVLGFGVLFAKAAHPNRDYLALHVHPQARRRGIGSKLLAALEPHFCQATVQTITPFLEAQAFLLARGFLENMRTYTPILELAKVALEMPILPDGYTFLPYTTDLRLPVARLHARVYTEQHMHNPTAEFSDLEALKVFMGDDLLPEAVTLIAFDAVPVAFSSLRGEPPELELAWFGVLDRHAVVRESLTKALLAQQIAVARQLGATVLLAELDSRIPEAILALAKLPFNDAEPWITYQRQ